MDDLLAQLDPDAVVLDLGSGAGSFPYHHYSFRVLAIDPNPPAWAAGPHAPNATWIPGRGGGIPLRDESVNVVVGSHLFEHLPEPAPVVREIARVLRRDGFLFAAVPDGNAFGDRLYRRWTLGGGHVQKFAFRRFQELIERNSDLELLHARRLYASFSFLHPRPEVAIHLPRRSQLLKYLPRWARDAVVGSLNAAVRLLDALAGTRLSLYGWGCYFGRPAARLRAVNREEFVNVCGRCGAGHPLGSIRKSAEKWLYRCPRCAAVNPLFSGPLSQRITRRLWDEEELTRALPARRPPDDRAGASGLPLINADGVVNAASYAAAIAPGALIAVFGKQLAGLDTELLVNGRPVSLLHVSNDQLTAWLPCDLPRGSAVFQVRHSGVTSPVACFEILLTAPGLFSADQSGQGSAALAGTVRPGGRVSLLATGLGPVGDDGATTRACRAWVGGRLVRVIYAGLRRRGTQSPARPEIGVGEVEVCLPDRLPPRCPVQIVVGGRASNVLDLPPPGD